MRDDRAVEDAAVDRLTAAASHDYANEPWHDGERNRRLAVRRELEELLASHVADAEAADRRAEDLLGVLAPGGAMVMTPAQAERLAWLIEECGEVQRAAAKVLRHGYAATVTGGRRTTRIALEQELGDLRAAIELLAQAADVRLPEIRTWESRAAQAAAGKMQFQPRRAAQGTGSGQ